MNQARVRFDFGELVVEYSSPDELIGKLEELQRAAEIITTKFGDLGVRHAQRQPKPGYEDTYRFLPDGTVELLLVPIKNVQRVAMVLFAYDQAVSVAIIEKCTNIEGVTRNVLQTGQNTKYFQRASDGRYSLSPAGYQWITSVVIPTLRRRAPTSAKASEE